MPKSRFRGKSAVHRRQTMETHNEVIDIDLNRDHVGTVNTYDSGTVELSNQDSVGRSAIQN